MKNTLLLDIDGVLIRDEVLLDHVKHNIVKYVHKKLPNQKNPYRLNNYLYMKYGHTATGLRKEYGVDTLDFDYRVYTPRVLDHLENFLDTREFKRDADILRNVLNMGWDVELFSNSPLVWSEQVKCKIDSHRVVNKRVYEKPSASSYTQFDPFREYLFVDDKVSNLLPTLFMDNLKQIHFSSQKEEEQLETVSSIDELFIKKIQPRHDHPAI